jgi:DNA replication and repair protein RecF
MKLRRILIHSFRNISAANMIAGSRFNIIYGDNAQGKTNLLESIYLLGTMKSFRSAKNRDLIRWEADSAHIKGWVEKNGLSQQVSVTVSPEGKKPLLDGKSLSSLGDFFGCLNVVVFSPEEIAMARGVPEIRRKYLDRAIFSGDIGYLAVHHEYHKILKHRNLLLRGTDHRELDVWTERLATVGAKLQKMRRTYVEQLSNLVRHFYAEIAGIAEDASIEYMCYRLGSVSTDENTTKNLLLEALERSRNDELRIRQTLVGPHRDDLAFTLNSKPLRNGGSQGQQRSFILALKMAEIAYLEEQFGHPPILLLDDMTSELDEGRKRNLMKFLNSRNMQVFITTTRLENINREEINECSAFEMKAGAIVH